MSIHIIVRVFCPAGLENMSTLHFASALLPAGWADDVQVVVTGGIITRVKVGAALAADTGLFDSFIGAEAHGRET